MHVNPETGEVTTTAPLTDTPDGVLAEETPAAERLVAFIQRVEKLDEELSLLRKVRKDVVQEAKSAGFDSGTMLAIIKRRARKAEEVIQSDRLLAHYSEAIDAPTAFSARQS